MVHRNEKRLDRGKTWKPDSQFMINLKLLEATSILGGLDIPIEFAIQKSMPNVDNRPGFVMQGRKAQVNQLKHQKKSMMRQSERELADHNMPFQYYYPITEACDEYMVEKL